MEVGVSVVFLLFFLDAKPGLPTVPAAGETVSRHPLSSRRAGDPLAEPFALLGPSPSLFEEPNIRLNIDVTFSLDRDVILVSCRKRRLV